MKIWTAWFAGAALVSLGSALAAQNAPTPAPAAAAAPAPRPAGPPPTPALGDGPWDVPSQEAKLHVEVVTKGLDHPWGMAFLPDGGMLVTERPGRLRLIRDGVLDPTPIGPLPEMLATGLGGLLDVSLHPRFTQNRLVYLAYSKPGPGAGNATTADRKSVV